MRLKHLIGKYYAEFSCFDNKNKERRLQIEFIGKMGE